MKWEYLKGSEKDFEGSPDHVLTIYTSDFGRKFMGGDSSENGSLDLIAERRPITKPVVTTEWDGEGLPPVGVICEWLPFSDEIRVVQIIAYHDGAVWLERRDKYSGIGELVGNPDNFRPIRSPECVARDVAIAKMVSILNEGTSTQDDARDIYNAIASGEIPGVKLE